MDPRVAELKALIRLSRPKRPKSTENIFFTWADAARTIGMSRRHLDRCRAIPGFPNRLPITRVALENAIDYYRYIERYKLEAQVLKLMWRHGNTLEKVARIIGYSRPGTGHIWKAAKANRAKLKQFKLV